MTEKSQNKMETLPDLDDLLQCPVCYEIPSGQIFQCNEGHHVCGRCKMRLDVCPVCRAFFFGTRNYAMEELIANVRKLEAFKLGGKVTTGSPPPEVATETRESSSEDTELTTVNINDDDVSSGVVTRHPLACQGLFRCLCCKKNPQRLPIARLLNHLRYFHSPSLIESRSENGGYLQAWQFPTSPGRMVTAVRVHDMGIFFLIIEVKPDSVYAWMSMAAAPWVAHEFSYTFTLSGNDREAIFSDCVWSVRACEGALKKQGRCLAVTGADARALVTPVTMSGKLSVRRTPHEMQPHVTRPRVVLRVANRSHAQRDEPAVTHDLEPFLQDLQDDVARLSRAFATLGREANALVRSEAQMRARLESAPAPAPAPAPEPAPVEAERHLSRSARRRMRQRLRQAFMESQPDGAESEPAPASVARPGIARTVADVTRPDSNRNVVSRPRNNQASNNAPRLPSNIQTATVNRNADNPNVSVAGRTGTGQIVILTRAANPPVTNEARSNNLSTTDNVDLAIAGREQAASSGPPPGPSADRPAIRNARNKKKRRPRIINL